jgi:hypothetical protein
VSARRPGAERGVRSKRRAAELRWPARADGC